MSYSYERKSYYHGNKADPYGDFNADEHERFISGIEEENEERQHPYKPCSCFCYFM